MMRQASLALASFFMFKYLPTALISTLLFGLLCKASGQVAKRASISEPSSSVQQGITLVKGGHCKEALALLKNAEPLELKGKWDAAAKEYKLVLEQNPRLPGIHFLLGRLLLSKPDPAPSAAEEAKREFQQELEIDPSNAGAEYVLGELARQENQLPDAIAHFSRATKLDAGFGDAFLGLGAALIST